jgi:hypothetical protein
MTNPKISLHGYKQWSNERGQYHREGGPAIVWENGSQVWYINGKIHRENGPAYIDINGYKEWYLNDEKYHDNKSFQEAASITDEDMLAMILTYSDIY